MIIESVDPRDTDWEVDHPAYRVYFWHQPPARPGVDRAQGMFHCTEYRLSEVVDVTEVLHWARETASSDQTFTLHVEHRHGDQLGLIQLMGGDPTRRD